MLISKLGCKYISVVDHVVTMHKALNSVPRIKHRHTVISSTFILVGKIINYSFKKTSQLVKITRIISKYVHKF